MNAANYGRPKPADPLWYRLDCDLEIRCSCGRGLTENVSDFGARHGLASTMKLYELIARLRCSGCGARPHAEVKRPGQR
jgi:hypothetical protein